MNIDSFKYFHDIAKLKSISKVATSSHISQPALSQQLLKLEEKLETTVLKRSNRGVELTTEGEIVLKYSEKFLDLYDNLLLELSKSKSGKKNLIINTTCLSASHILLSLFPKLSLKFTDLCYDISNKYNTNVTSDLINNVYDINLGCSPVDDSDLSSVCLGYDNLIFVSKSSDVSNINNLPFLLLEDELNLKSHINNLIDSNNIILRTSNIDILINYLLTIPSIALLPKVCIKNQLSEGTLKELESTNLPTTKYNLFLTYKKDTSYIVKENINFIQEHIKTTLDLS